MKESEWMQAAIAIARRGLQQGQTPFGAVIVRDEQLVCEAHNTVWATCDPTAHAEINAIRLAAATLKSISLNGTVMYTTCEPCPMCLSGIHWSKIDRVVYGATISDAAEAGFTELNMPAKQLATQGGSALIVESGLLQEECASLFEEWKKLDLSGEY